MKEEERTVQMLLCSHCPKEFRYNSERQRHELSHFPRFECKTCCKKFSFISALRRHQKQHERTGSVKCEECNRKFRDDVLLRRHIKYAHKGTSICEKCNSKFSSDLALRTHMMTHRPESERRFKCSHSGCTKSFNFSHHLKHHELTHTNAKQHYCSFCGKGFIQSHHLKTHMKAHDPSGWQFCEIAGCKKKFATDYARKRHMAIHKNKPDSGISSDSNSCDASISSKDYTEESILCANCGETISQNKYETHAKKCNYEEKPIVKEDSQTIVEEWPNSPFKPNAFESTSTKSVIKRDMGVCDIMLGDCIVKSDFICAQMAKPVNKNYDLTPIGSNMNNDNIANDSNIIVDVSRNNPANLHYHESSNSEVVDDPKPVIVRVGSITDYKQNSQVDMCEGCDCANICNAKISMYDITPDPVDLSAITVKNDRTAPNIEYRTDGVIKIKETFDDDILVKIDRNYLNSKRFIPFSTCKDVIGNCLVSGGDGCLCARMIADEDQAIMAQEIDDITPQPKTEPL